MGRVTDPALLAALDGPVEDPELLRQLNAQAAPLPKRRPSDTLPPALPGEAAYQGPTARGTEGPTIYDRLRQYGQRVNEAAKGLNAMRPGEVLPAVGSAAWSMARSAAAPVLGSAAGMTTGLMGGDEAEQRRVAEAMQARVAGQPGAGAQKVLGAVGAVAQPLTEALESSGADQALLPLAPELSALKTGPLPPRVANPRTPEEALRRAGSGADSASAAASGLNLQGAQPELLNAITRAGRRGGSVNVEAAERQLNASRLPVPAPPLTAGQASRDVTLLSDEQNWRRAHPEIGERFDAQNQALAANMRELRERIGPDVFSTNNLEHGETLIDAYRQLDRQRRADIRSKYAALENANGGHIPIDATQLLHDVGQELTRTFSAEFVPTPVQNILNRIGTRPITLEEFENFRTVLSRESRKAERAADGSAVHAIGVVRDGLENLPITPGVPMQVKQLADDARAAARARFQALDADPAYKAVVRDTVHPDDFISRFVLGAGGKRDNLELMQQAIGGAIDPTTGLPGRVGQTISVAALDRLRSAAALNPAFEGNFAGASYNKMLESLSPKIQHLLQPGDVEHLRNIGQYATDSTFLPRGHSVSTSGTGAALLGAHGANVAEHAVNIKFGGWPVGTVGRKGIERLRDSRKVRRSLEPGAGIRNED